MALDALSCNELLNFIIHDTISVTPYSSLESSGTTTAPAAATAAAAFIFETEHSLNLVGSGDGDGGVGGACTPSIMNMHCLGGSKPNARKATLGVPGRKRRRRRPKVCKNKEEEETQRMTHIAVERNRRKQMNEHLAALRSLMPESYVQRGDQASVVGGAIMFVKEMEHLLQSLEAKKLEQKLMEEETQSQTPPPPPAAAAEDTRFMRPPFSHFFVCPQYTWLQLPSNSGSKYSSTSSSSASFSSSRSSGMNGNDNGNGGGGVMAAIADIEVTLIETHANLRILSRRSPMQLSRLVAGFHTLQLSILHLNVFTLHPLVLYSISAKVEEGCQLTTVDDISGAVHHMLRIIEEGESALC